VRFSALVSIRSRCPWKALIVFVMASSKRRMRTFGAATEEIWLGA